ncbi:glycogen synthase, partial [bacterium]
KEINFKPDVIHCHDWQAALIPIYLKSIFKDDDFYKYIKTVFTIHNIGYQGIFPRDEFAKLGLDWSYYNMEMLEFYDRVNILKGGLVFSDFITTVSVTYSKEIQTPELGFGMEGILCQRSKSVFGIINGLDYNIWNPQDDPYIKVKFSLKNIQDKASNKEDLQKACKFSPEKDVSLFGIVSRLAEQKGVDILVEALEDILNMDLQLVILGTGDQKYHKILEKIARKYPRKFSLNLKFDDPLAHKIYAGSDIFVMPSKYEPCGLGQLISLKYGTIPLVYKTGGLADTVNQKNGFVFDKYAKDELVKTAAKAVSAFKDKNKWPVLVKTAMECNFSWAESAKKYIKLYEKK